MFLYPLCTGTGHLPPLQCMVPAGELSRVSLLLLFQEWSSNGRGSPVPWQPWRGWGSAELGGGGCSSQAPVVAHRETGTAARSAAFGMAHVHQAASVSAELALTEQGKLCQALQAGIFHGFITWARVEGEQYPSSSLQIFLPHNRGMPVIF